MLVETRRQAVEVRSRTDDETWARATYGSGDLVVLQSVELAIAIAAFYRGMTF